MSKAKNVPLRPVFTPPSRIVWTDERLDALGKEQLMNLLGNLETQRSSGRISDATATDLDVRIRSRLPARAALRRRRPQSEVRAEARAAEQLGELAVGLARRYDMGADSATKASSGIKGFRPVPMTDRKGRARCGGSVKHGVAAVERYVGYRSGDSFAGLAFVLLADGSQQSGSYVLLGTDDLIDDSASQPEYAQLAGHHGWSTSSRARMRAHAVSGFEEGAERYEALVARLAVLQP